MHFYVIFVRFRKNKINFTAKMHYIRKNRKSIMQNLISENEFYSINSHRAL